MKRLKSKRSLVILAIALLSLFLVRPSANRLRARIVSSISLALGRPVEVSWVKLRLLPRPGFDLENFVVEDDPAFSAEPIVRSQEVTAALRISSLLRGHLEIARLSLSDPSLNLVRNAGGHWNLESLIERTAKMSVAPTAKSKREIRPGFPYIEADNARINFKFEHEKTPYALTNADLSLWQDSENTWGMRLEAQPVRTDFSSSDTGILRVNGSWQRAASLGETPLRFALRWERAQLGQISKLTYGSDKGWRGTILVSSTLSGTPANLILSAEGSVQDFRRYDIPGGSPLRLEAQCDARYSSADRRLSDLSCQAPVGNGTVLLSGNLVLAPRSRDYHLAFAAHDLSLESAVQLFRRVKKDVPADLRAAGTVAANLTVGSDEHGTSSLWAGSGETSGFRLRSKSAKSDLLFDRVHFTVGSGASELKHPELSRSTYVDVGPVGLPLGRPAPAVLRGQFSRAGYTFGVRGEAQIRRLLQAAQGMGIPIAATTADGTARVDLQLAGDWKGFAPPSVVGKAQLHAVHPEIAGLNQPVEITSANLVLTPDVVQVSNLSATLAEAVLHGSMNIPRHCATKIGCPVEFNLSADTIDEDTFTRLVSPAQQKLAWYRFLSFPSKPTPAYLAALHASGKVNINRLAIRNVVANRISADVRLAAGKVELSNLRADVLGGTHNGNWSADYTKYPPEYSGSGSIRAVALERLAEATNDGWITGTAAATYDVEASGTTWTDLLSSATGSLRVDAVAGSLPHLIPASGTGVLRMNRLAMRVILAEGKWEIAEGKLESPSGTYQMHGTASPMSNLDLRLMRDSTHGFSITGPLTSPHVERTTTPETQAALKP